MSSESLLGHVMSVMLFRPTPSALGTRYRWKRSSSVALELNTTIIGE